jgi:hypothetical protein
VREFWGEGHGTPNPAWITLGLDTSSMGRFMSPDPLLNSGHPSDPQSWNRYTYAANNPLLYVDPTGLFEWKSNCDEQMDAACHLHRQEIRDGLAKLKDALNSDKISDEDKQKIKDVLWAYGEEGKDNGVFVAFGSAGGNPAQTKSIQHAVDVELVEPEQLTQRPPFELQRDQEYSKFTDALHAYKPGSTELKWRISATIYGRFDYVLKKGKDGKYIRSPEGFGHLNASPMRLVLQAVSGVRLSRRD